MAENGSSPPENRKHSRTGNRNRTNSESGTSITSSSSSYTLKAPDGGWGWVVVAAAFFVNMIADGVTFSFTYLFQVQALVKAGFFFDVFLASQESGFAGNLRVLAILP